MFEPMDLLFTLDEGYLQPLKVALTSIYDQHSNQKIRIWLIHEVISERNQQELTSFVTNLGWEMHFIKADGTIWEEAPTVERYPKEMYFRLLAGQILPPEITKVLYLDPDILVINSLDELWNLDLNDYLFAAATHKRMLDLTTKFNQIRLDTDHGYYNSGVMLINLVKARELVDWADIQAVIGKFNKLLMLPDQDILNHLYGKYALEIPEEVWNYDTRLYTTYLAKSFGKQNIQWVMQHTSILHFCGKPKPWNEKSDSRFTALYLNYQNLSIKMDEISIKNH